MAQGTGLNFLDTVSTSQKAFVARQLSVMLDAGLPLLQAISSLANQSSNYIVKASLTQVVTDLQNGFTFSSAIKKHPKLFSSLFVSSIEAGETSGQLDKTMRLLADELEKDSGFRGRVIGALLYPAFIVVAMIVVGIIMVTRIVPALETVFSQSGITLPWTTLMVVAITNSLINYWYVYLLILVAIIYGLRVMFSNDSGRRFANTLLIKTPILGKVFVDMEMARLTRILGILITAGVPIIQAINTVSETLDSIIYRDVLKIMAHDVERGAQISDTLAKYPVFPTTVTEMIGVGEHTGKLSVVLEKLADYYETETDQETKNLAAIIEPIVFVIVGLGVAFLVFSIIVPIYSLSSAIQ